MKKRELLQTFIYCLLITGITSAGFIYSDPHNALNLIYICFVFSVCIGYSIHFFMALFDRRIKKLTPISRNIIRFFLFLLAGFVGTEVGIKILRFVFIFAFSEEDHLRLLAMNSIFAALFGTFAIIYFTMKANAEKMAATLKEKELNEERLTRLKSEAELQALQAKINPHFLFNTLNSIASLISENPKAAEATVEKLSELFRYTLKNAEQNSVTIAEELSIVRTYLEIEKVRFSKRMEYEIHCDPALNEFTIPALIIQPLVENSIKHGIAPEIDGGKIFVSVTRKEQFLHISVTDNGKGLGNERNSNGFGLRSIEERLQLRYGESASLRVVPDDRTHFLITIPV